MVGTLPDASRRIPVQFLEDSVSPTCGSLSSLFWAASTFSAYAPDFRPHGREHPWLLVTIVSTSLALRWFGSAPASRLSSPREERNLSHAPQACAVLLLAFKCRPGMILFGFRSLAQLHPLYRHYGNQRPPPAGRLRGPARLTRRRTRRDSATSISDRDIPFQQA
jgi:hypothetical protein